MLRLRSIVGFFVAACLGWTGGCSRAPADAVHLPPAEAEPQVLRIAFVPQVDMEERYDDAYRALEAYLAPALGLKVEVVQVESVNVALEGLRGRKLDLCNFSPWPFLIAERKAGMQALLVTAGADGLPVSYRTILIARPDLGLRSFDELRARAGQLVFSFEEPVSTSGHLVPRTFFHAVGFDPEASFKQVLFSPDSTVSILAVKSGRLDVAAVSRNGFDRAIEKNRIGADELAVLWTSDPVLANVVAIRRELPDAFKARVRDALVRMADAAPELWAVVARQYSNPVSRYLPADDAHFARFREAVEHVAGLQIAL